MKTTEEYTDLKEKNMLVTSLTPGRTAEVKIELEETFPG